MQNRINVLNAFQASGEFSALTSTLYGSATSDNQRTESFVNNFYLGAYGRNATSTELQQQRDALNAAAGQGLSQVQSQAEAMGRSLFASQVTDYSITDQQFVTNLYEGFLQRGPSTVVTLGERVESLYESAATKNEMQNQSAAIRGNIQQIQQRLNVIKHTLTR